MNNSEYKIIYTEDAINDLKKLDGSVKSKVVVGINKASKNPLPKSEGGYGKPLGNKNNRNLTNYLELKFRGMGIRVVYQLIRTDKSMKIVVVGVRKDDDVFIEAQKRITKYTK